MQQANTGDDKWGQQATGHCIEMSSSPPSTNHPPRNKGLCIYCSRELRNDEKNTGEVTESRDL